MALLIALRSRWGNVPAQLAEPKGLSMVRCRNAVLQPVCLNLGLLAGRGILVALIALAGQYIAVDVSNAEDAHLGITEFEIACLPCHGVEGRGDGPLAHNLLVRPSDLTQISKANDGVFPEEKVTELIDGRSVGASHLSREMPVWGHRYRKLADPGESDAAIDQRAHERIDALVRYLASIQEN